MSSAPSSVHAWRRSSLASTSWQSQSGTSAAVSARLPSRGSDSAPLTTTRTGLARAIPRSRTSSRGSSLRTVPAPTSTASDCAPHQVDLRPRPRPGDPAALAGAGGDPAVERGGELQRHHRPPGREPASGSRGSSPPPRRRGSRPRRRCPAAASRAIPAPFDPRVGVLGGDHHAGDAGRDQRLGAGRRRAGVGAGLERDVGGGAARPLARLGSASASAWGRPPSPVRPRPTTRSRPRDDDAAHRRIGPHPPEAAPRQPEGRAHPARVPVFLVHGVSLPAPPPPAEARRRSPRSRRPPGSSCRRSRSGRRRRCRSAPASP